MISQLKWIGLLEQFGGTADVDLSGVQLHNMDLHDRSFDNLHLVRTIIEGVNLSSTKDGARNLSNSSFRG